MKKNINIAAYGEGILFPPQLALNMKNIQNAGWTSLMVSLFQVSAEGDISINGNALISNGKYVADPNWPQQLLNLKSSGTIKTLLATFGGWDSAFQNIQDIYDQNGTFKGTQLEANCKVFRNTFPAFDLIDMDVEYPNGKPQNAEAAFVAFCEMWIEVGFNITFCPYEDIPFWTNSLVAIENKYPGTVKWWNLQCYAGGAGNNPENWANAIKNALPTFNTDGYILASDWSRFWNSSSNDWQGNCPNAVNSLISQFKGQSCLGGGFIWTIDQIINYSTIKNTHPDPQSCGDVGMTDYVEAIKTAIV